jgi:tetratricopeptide (TPR) repeat protein
MWYLGLLNRTLAALAIALVMFFGAWRVEAQSIDENEGLNELQTEEPGSPKAESGKQGRDAAAPEKPYHRRVLQNPPKTPREAAEVLANLYALLATAPDESTSNEISEVIERLWLFSHGDTVFVLMQRASKALAEKNEQLALKFLDAAVDLAPDYAEAWHQRAVVHYSQNDFALALGDLRRVLALDPNHYKALEGLSRMLEETGQDAGALAAHRQLMTVHPFWPNAEQRLRELERKTEGQGI